MEQSVLDKIAKLDIRSYDGWRNGKNGHITDAFLNGVYRFFEENKYGVGWGKLVHQNVEDNPLVAVGIVAYWMEHRHGDETVRQMYENYTQKRFEQFKKCLKNDAETWEWEEEDWKRFFYLKASEREAHWNKMSEPLFDYITESDAQRVRPVMDNYIKYLEKCREAYQTPSTDEEKQELINKLVPLFNSEEEAKKFPNRIKGLDDKKIPILVNQLWLKDVIADTTTKQDLWQVLHDAGLYTKGISTWNSQVIKPEK